MKSYFLIPILILFIFTGVTTAYEKTEAQNFAGYLLVSTLEPGASSRPQRLFLANAANGTLSELLVENESIAALWFGWSPDGSSFAYLAPARQGIHYELWLANASGTNARTPFLTEGEQTAVAAAWNPIFNIVAVATASENTRDGLFVVNADTDNIVILAEEKFAENPLLDWSRDAYYLTYNTADNALKIINTADRATVQIQNPGESIPTLPPLLRTGWAINDSQYLWTDARYSVLQPVSVLEGIDPFTIQMFSDGSALVDFDGFIFRHINPTTGQVSRTIEIPEEIFVENFGLASDKSIFFNGITTDANGNSVMQCYKIGRNNLPQQVSLTLGGTWTHTRCAVLGTHLALTGTLNPESWERLPQDMLFSLYLLPTDLSQIATLTDSYAGFEFAPLGFSGEQVVFQEGQALVVYNLQGEKRVLANLADLDIQSSLVQYRFAWQP